MILIDTSVWIDHLRKPSTRLFTLIDSSQILVHPFVTGELAMGSLHGRGRFLNELDELPQMAILTSKDVIRFVGKHRLYGTGISYIDAHLLAAAHNAEDVQLWTNDKRLHAASARLNIAATL